MSAAKKITEGYRRDPMTLPLWQQFGGKSSVSRYIAKRIGKVKQYIEPFCGTASVLIAKEPSSLEVINDLNFYIANFFRALQSNPGAVFDHCDQPGVHIELHARHAWLTAPGFTRDLAAKLCDPDWPGDHKAAGWWVWGQAHWIGQGWCVPGFDASRKPIVKDGATSKKILHASDGGRGVAKQILHAGNGGRGVAKQILHASGGRGVAKQILHASDGGQGVGLIAVMQGLSTRLRHVRVQNCTWERATNHHYGLNGNGTVGVFLDPPYRDTLSMYGDGFGADDLGRVVDFARELGKNNRARVILCGMAGDYELPGWEVIEWKRTSNTYGKSNATKNECLWLSPGCVPEGEDEKGLEND